MTSNFLSDIQVSLDIRGGYVPEQFGRHGPNGRGQGFCGDSTKALEYNP